jgi:LPS-assembly lipoprotein
MWSFRRNPCGVFMRKSGSARAGKSAGMARAAIGFALMLGLSSCIHPLYGSNGVNAQLAQIEVSPIADRVGHYLAEELKFQTDGSGTPPPPRYRLEATVTENVGGLLVNLRSLSSDAAQVTLTVTYKLVEIGSDKQITSGAVSSAASYDRSEQRFANVRAARDSEIRAAVEAADLIRTRLSLALQNQK